MDHFNQKHHAKLEKRFLNKSRNASNKAIINLIDNGGRHWINDQYHLKFVVKLLKYKRFPDGVDDLICQIPVEKLPKGWMGSVSGGNQTKICEQFSKVVHSKSKNYLGWPLETC